ANIDLAGAEVELVYKKSREKVLKGALDKVKSQYDYLLIDCPPSLGLLTINALAAADSVVIPIQSEYYALEGLSQLMNSISLVRQHLNKNLKVEGVVLTMYDGRSIISRQIAEEIKKFFTKKLYEIVIPRNVRLSEAPSHGKPILLHDPKCAGARAYSALTEEFLNKTEGRE
ncbi:MAG: ParA family protein, partial [Clostridiales bacterium]|nr:ParA family protein [Clostridiales bacterium]